MKATEANITRDVRSLCQTWLDQPRVEVDSEKIDENVFLNCMGYSTAAVECMLGYLDMAKENRIPRGVLARSLFELGVTTVWLSLQGKPGLDALVYEKKRLQRALAFEVAESDNEQLRKTAERVKARPLPEKPYLADEARNLDRMMGALDSGQTPLYAIYRLYSGYAHASLDVANSYVVEDDDGQLLVQIPGPHSAMNDHLGTAVAPLVWAVNACNKMLRGKPLTPELNQLQVLLGTGIDFKLKEDKQPS